MRRRHPRFSPVVAGIATPYAHPAIQEAVQNFALVFAGMQARVADPAAQARIFDAAVGSRTPISLYVERWGAEKKFAPRTLDAARHSVKLLEQWCEKEGIGAHVEAIDSDVAQDFKTEALVELNEAKTASGTSDYVLHLWFVAKQPQLYVVPFREAAKHLPADQGSGTWATTRIPFAAFSAFRVLEIYGISYAGH